MCALQYLTPFYTLVVVKVIAKVESKITKRMTGKITKREEIVKKAKKTAPLLSKLKWKSRIIVFLDNFHEIVSI